MSPLEYIEEGIREGNWKTVCEGYERLTGKALPLPTTVIELESIPQNALQQIADIISSTFDTELEKPTKKKKVGRPKANKKKVRKKKYVMGIDPAAERDNHVQEEIGRTRFITNDPDPKEVAENKARAAKVNRVKRKPPAIHDVECNECGKTFESDRPDGEMGQKCRECLRGKKDRFV